MRWQTSTRYYIAHVQQDLLGDWQVHRMWGGRGSQHGGSLVELASDEGDAQHRLNSIARTRVKRGYLQVTHPSPM